MEFNSEHLPENPQLKEYFSWRATSVTEAQQKNLLNKLGDEICMRARFIAYVKMSAPPERIENNRAYFPKGTRMIYCTVTDKEGRQYFPVFTSETEMKKWKEVQSVGALPVIVTFNDFAPIMNTGKNFTGVVIDPMSDNFFMSKDLINAWTLNKAKILSEARKHGDTHTD